MNDKGEQVSFGLLELDTWNTYISYNAAAKKFEGVSMPYGQIPVYRIGTRGEVIKGEVFPKSKQFNGRSSVEIEALDLDKVMPFEVSEYFDTMWQISQAWAKCPRWNASGGMVAEAVQDIVVPDPTEEEIPY